VPRFGENSEFFRAFETGTFAGANYLRFVRPLPPS
jgi:hypothetical protein